MSRLRINTSESPIVFISATVYRRQRIFSNPIVAQRFIEVIKLCERRKDLSIHAYCVIPDHYHAVIELAGQKTLSQILHSIHSYFVHFYFKDILQSPNTLKIFNRAWDEWIRNERMYWQKIAYTLLNPWRAGLVGHPYDSYPFSNIDEFKSKYGMEFLSELLGEYN